MRRSGVGPETGGVVRPQRDLGRLSRRVYSHRMGRRIAGTLGVLCITLCLATTEVVAADVANANRAAWEYWNRDLHGICPAHHVDWLYGAAYPYLYDGFDATLVIAGRQHVNRLADVERNCADETVGHSCELGNHLRAYRVLDLFHRFTTYTCSHVKCEEEALCSRAPGQR